MAGKKIETKKANKTLQTAQEVGYFGKKMLIDAIQAQKEGKPIGWSMVNWWEGDIIAKAMGIHLVYPENWGAFCASIRQAEPYLEIADSEGFPNSLCGYARNNIGYAKTLFDNNYVIPQGAPGGGLAKPMIMLASGAACDARYKWFQAMGRYLEGVPVWTLEMPQTGPCEFLLPENKAQNLKFIVDELKLLIEFLEKLLGKKMDYAKLEGMVDQVLKTLRIANEIDLLRRAVPSPMVSQDFWAIMILHFYLPEDPEAYAFYERVYAEVKNKVDKGIGAIPNEKYRMMFAELPPWHSLGFFDDIAEKYGIAMVMESESYHVPAPMSEAEIDGVNDPLELIARLCYHKFMEYNDAALQYSMSPAFLGPSALEWAELYRVDGMMVHPLMSCRTATYTLLQTIQRLEEKRLVPGVVINGDIVDLRVFNPEDALSKIEAFTETMDHYRELRRKAGMSW